MSRDSEFESLREKARQKIEKKMLEAQARIAEAQSQKRGKDPKAAVAIAIAKGPGANAVAESTGGTVKAEAGPGENVQKTSQDAEG